MQVQRIESIERKLFMKKSPPARIHLLTAKSSPYVVVFRRKPTDWFHVLRWNTETNDIEHGSWFNGTLYPKRADVSHDGKWLLFLAMDKGVNTYNRISHPPSHDPIVDIPGTGTYRGGGYWKQADSLSLNGWEWPYLRGLRGKTKEAIPFKIEDYADELGDDGVLYRRLERDGWVRFGEGTGIEMRTESDATVVRCFGNDELSNRPTSAHPTLRMRFVGYKHGTSQFRFWLEEFPKLIDEKVDWACWDSLGQLVFSRLGVLYKYRLEDLSAGKASTIIDLEHLSPPDSVKSQ